MENTEQLELLSKLPDGETLLNARGMMPLVAEIKGMENRKPLRAMTIPYIPKSDMINGIADPYLQIDGVIRYNDNQGALIDIRLEWLAFGPMHGIAKGYSLIQFSVVDDEK